MIIMVRCICHWFHGDATYRAILTLLILTGAWAATVEAGPIMWGRRSASRSPVDSLANALTGRGRRAPMTGTSYWYMHTQAVAQRRLPTASLASPLSTGTLGDRHTADAIAQSARLGWMPFYPQFSCNPLDVADEATAAVDAGDAENWAPTSPSSCKRVADLAPWATSTPRKTGCAPFVVAVQPARILAKRETSTSCEPCSVPSQRAGLGRTKRSARGKMGVAR